MMIASVPQDHDGPTLHAHQEARDLLAFACDAGMTREGVVTTFACAAPCLAGRDVACWPAPGRAVQRPDCKRTP